MTLSAPAIWFGFLVCLALIFFSGTRLSRYGHQIAIRTGLGATWVGVVLVAGVTSLPELVTGISSITVVNAPDLAVGDALGSCIVNLMIIVILDFIHRRDSIYTHMHQGHILSAGFGVVLLGTAAGAIILQRQFSSLAFFHVGLLSLVTPLIYLIAMRSVFSYEQRERKSRLAEVAEVLEAQAAGKRDLTLGQIYFRYALNAGVIMVAGIALPIVGEQLATVMGWEQTFVGTVFLAVATSVPEVVISVEAVRIGSVDLAIGNILGSNLFNLLILTLDDFVYTDGILLADANFQHLFTAIAALTMTGVVIVGLLYRPRGRVLRLVGWVSLGLFTVGLLNAVVLFLLN
ncbi:MAG: sodium:calcium antiporter [Gemmatimonadota bacterium]